MNHINKVFLLQLYLFLTVLFSYSQNNQDFIKNYENYFKLNQENIYSHINKSTFFKGEEIWMKIYVFDNKTNKPFKETTNIYVTVYDGNGTPLDKKLIACTNGMAYHNIKVDDLFSPGLYYIETTTNWMSNFENPLSDLKEITISTINKESHKSNTHNYTVEIKPEGGQIIEGAQNSIGVQVNSSKKENISNIKGFVFDSKNELVAWYETNTMGLAKFNLKPKKGENYTNKIISHSKDTIVSSISDISVTGANLTIQNYNNEFINIVCYSNETTVLDLGKKDYTLMIHRDGIYETIDIQFTENQFEKIIKLPKSSLLPHINIATLFDENQNPVSERIFYNETKSNNDKLHLLESKTLGDSSKVVLKLDSKNIGKKSFSISILPASNKAYNTINSLKSSLLLKPYTKDVALNTRFYFNNQSRKNLTELDLFLLAQGWSKYNWNHISFTPPLRKYNFENGLTLSGKVNGHSFKKGDFIHLVSVENGISEDTNLKEDNTFIFNNLIMIDSSKYKLYLRNKKGKNIKTGFYTNISPNKKTKPLQISKSANHFSDSTLIEIPSSDFILSDDVVQLDEISLKGQKKDHDKLPSQFGSKFGKINIDLSKQYSEMTLVTDIIRLNGFDVINNGGQVSITSRRAISLSKVYSPAVYINNIYQGSDLTQLDNLMVADVESLYISRSGSSLYGSLGTGGVIEIMTKIDALGNKSRPKDYFDAVVPFGFEIPLNYSHPIYNNTNTEQFTKYACISWLPSVTTNSKNELSFSFLNKTKEKVILYIEGMSENGEIFSEIIKL